MAVKRKEIRVYVEKIMIFSIRTSYRFARDHPFVFSLVLFLLILYRSFPLVFSLLISSSPVIICTTLLLGLLLSFGEANIPEIHLHDEHEKKTEVSSPKVDTTVDNPYVERDEKLTVEAKQGEDGEVIIANGALLGSEKASISCKSEVEIITATTQYESPGSVYSIKASSSSGKQENDEIDCTEKMSEEMGFRSYEITESREIFLEKPDDHLKEKLSKDVIGSSTENRELEGLKLDIAKELDKKIDSSLGSPWQHINSAVTFSDSESDGGDSSSSDASMADIIPMLDGLSSPANSKQPGAVCLSEEDSGDTSQCSSEDHETDDDSVDGEAETHKDEEDEEVQGENNHLSDGAVIWTEDDHKNLMDLGSSEIERNRRLESLIAKRRARKNPTIAMERNLIDLDPNERLVSKDDLFRHIPHIYAPRRNPFDEEEMLMPGSAPSSLLPRGNPFDVTNDEQSEANSSQRDPWGHQEFTLASSQDIWLKRNETFNFDRKQVERPGRTSRFRPYFVPETMESEEGSSSAFERQLSGKSDSKVSSIPQSDSASSVSDHDYHKEIIEEEFHQETELVLPPDHDAALMDQRSQSSDEVESVTVEPKSNDINDHEIVLGSYVDSQEIRQNAETLASVIDEDRNETDWTSTATYFEKFEVVEDHYEEPSSPSFSEEDEESFNTTIPEHLASFQQGDLCEPLLGESREIAESINDSGPLAHSRVPSCSEASDFADKGVHATSSLESASEELLLDSWKITQVTVQDPIEVVSSLTQKDSKQLISAFTTKPDAFGTLDHLNFASPVIQSTVRTATEVTSHVTEDEMVYATPPSTSLPLREQTNKTEESDASTSDSPQIPSEYLEGVDPKIKDDPMYPSVLKSEFSHHATNAVPVMRQVSNHMLHSSDGESGDIHPLVFEHRDFDESLLSELDVVGDFHSEGLRSNHQSSKLNVGTKGQYQDNITGLSYLECLPVQKASDNISVDSLLQNLDSEVSYSVQSSDVNHKQTTYNPKLEATAIDEDESDFNDFLEPAMPLSFSESDLQKLLQWGSTKSDLAKRNLERAPTVPELPFLEAMTFESMNSAKKIREASESTYKNPEVMDDFHGGQNMVPMTMQSDMQYFEADSLEDVYAAFTAASNSYSEFEPEVLEVQSINEVSLLSTDPHHETCSKLEEHEQMLHLELHGMAATSVDYIHEGFEENSNANNRDAASAPDDDVNTLHFVENVGEASSTAEQNRQYTEAMKLELDLHATFPDDVHAVFKKLSDANVQKDEAGKDRVSERQLESELLQTKTDENVTVLRTEDTKTSSSVEPYGDELGTEKASDTAGFLSHLQEKLKKKKAEAYKSNSSSDSSSSSSSSDSD